LDFRVKLQGSDNPQDMPKVGSQDACHDHWSFTDCGAHSVSFCNVLFALIHRVSICTDALSFAVACHHLLLVQIRWEDRFRNDRGKTCLVTVDGTDFRICQPHPFSKKWHSHKCRGPGARCELPSASKLARLFGSMVLFHVVGGLTSKSLHDNSSTCLALARWLKLTKDTLDILTMYEHPVWWLHCQTSEPRRMPELGTRLSTSASNSGDV